MKRLYTCILSLFVLLGLSGCWKENLKNCWMGDVTLRVVAGKFQHLPGETLEAKLSDRIETLHYYLYYENVLFQQGVIDSKTALDVQQYIFSFSKLGFGNYSLALLANVDEDEIKETDVCENLLLDYPGASNTKDYFVSCYHFKVDCECGLDEFVELHRAQGVTQLLLENLPENITEVEVVLDKLSQSCGVDTVYQGAVNTSYRVKVADVKEENMTSFAIGTFPTILDEQTEVILRLYADGNPEFVAYESKVGDINVGRNQLVRINADFKHSISGKVDFGIQVNPEWDGVGGGDVPVE